MLCEHGAGRETVIATKALPSPHFDAVFSGCKTPKVGEVLLLIKRRSERAESLGEELLEERRRIFTGQPGLSLRPGTGEKAQSGK